MLTRRAAGESLSLDGKGEPLTVTGRVLDLDGGGPVVDHATVETWQANGVGSYESQQPDLQPEFNLRGKLTTDANGAFHYQTVRPGGYAVPLDGPVGRLVASHGLPLRRPAHLHFLIRAEGFEPVCTHVFDGADPDLDKDALFAMRPELVGDFRRTKNGSELDFTFVMARAKHERRAA